MSVFSHHPTGSVVNWTDSKSITCCLMGFFLFRYLSGVFFYYYIWRKGVNNRWTRFRLEFGIQLGKMYILFTRIAAKTIFAHSKRYKHHFKDSFLSTRKKEMEQRRKNMRTRIPSTFFFSGTLTLTMNIYLWNWFCVQR